MSEELKPCPFCGSEAEIERRGHKGQSTIYACQDCGCRLETGEEFNFGAAWNRRPSPSPGSVEEVASELRRLAGSKSGVAQAGYVTVAATELEHLARQIVALLPGGGK